MKGKELFHICNLSPKIIFRNQEDYTMAVNRLAISAHSTNSEIWAYSIMSTHFHVVVRTSNIENFIKSIKRHITIWHNNKYNNNVKLSISFKELSNPYYITTAINYVLKNPIHHSVCDIAFRYPYSSIHCYFKSDLYREDYFFGERPQLVATNPSNLSLIKKRHLFGRNEPPESFRILSDIMVLPESFVNYKYVEKIYSTPRQFMFNMNKPLKEELEEFNYDEMSVNNDHNTSNLTGKLNDLEVCKLIDNLLHPKLFTQLTEGEIMDLWKQLKRYGVDRYQFQRAI